MDMTIISFMKYNGPSIGHGTLTGFILDMSQNAQSHFIPLMSVCLLLFIKSGTISCAVNKIIRYDKFQII